MRKIGLLLVAVALCAQTVADQPVIVNAREAKFQHDSDDPPGGESLMLRMDKKTGGMEFFARYPAGYAFKPHQHKSNERFLLLEGTATVDSGGKKTQLQPGGFSYFPAGTMHSHTCGAESKCMWYLMWDGKP